LKNYEKESLFKNFLVFFSLLEILLVLLFIELYRTQKTEYRHNLLQNMRLCSYSLECEEFSFDFAPQGENILNKLYDNNGTHAYFTIPKSKKYYMKITYAPDKLYSDIQNITHALWVKFFLASLLLFGVALFFTFYSLNPIRKALRLNDEFIKDILHDFNTPITSMILNIKMLKDEKGDEPHINRLTKSIENLLRLQNNLKSFLHNSPSQNETINISSLLEERLKNIESMYPDLAYIFNKHNELIKVTNHELLMRIFDNILSNAAKYNKRDGEIRVTILNDSVIIKDTGKGIKNVGKVLQRYYKEQDRGVGLGLHIVNKLCNELNIGMQIQSQVDHGTKITLNFQHLKKA
jgi:two-component system, OmpR family, sensor kinase